MLLLQFTDSTPRFGVYTLLAGIENDDISNGKAVISLSKKRFSRWRRVKIEFNDHCAIRF